MEKSKFETYAGFAVRSGKLVRGMNAAECTRKRMYSLWLCASASENTKKQAAALARARDLPLYVTKDALLADLVHKENCKLAAFLDQSLSDAAANADDMFLKMSTSIGGV